MFHIGLGIFYLPEYHLYPLRWNITIFLYALFKELEFADRQFEELFQLYIRPFVERPIRNEMTTV